MFKGYNIYLKVLVLLITYTGIFFLETWLYELSLNAESDVIKIILDFMQSWLIMLFGFLFFQTFKYVRLPKKYYLQRQIESEFFFKFTGVYIFQHILINSFLRHANPRVYLKGRKREYIKIYHGETQQSETSHLFTLIITLIVQGFYLFEGEIWNFIWLGIFSVIFNLYPMLLQRKNRFYLESKFKVILQ